MIASWNLCFLTRNNLHQAITDFRIFAFIFVEVHLVPSFSNLLQYFSQKNPVTFFYHFHLSNNFIYISLHYLYFGKIKFVFNTIMKRIPIRVVFYIPYRQRCSWFCLYWTLLSLKQTVQSRFVSQYKRGIYFLISR